MGSEYLDELPLDFGMREAAVFLGINHATLSRSYRNSASPLAPDRARMAGGKLNPSWSRERLEAIEIAGGY